MQNQAKISTYAARLIGRFFDCCSAFLLGLYALFVVGPLGFLRGPLMFERFFWYFRVFASLGLLTRAVRVAIDWRLGHFDVAISQAEEVVERVEQYNTQKPDSQIVMRVLGDLYTILTRAYLHAGHMDEAMRIVLRAKKHLGSERLAGLADLDAKTAHLVRAGLAAGRLLDGGGLATMFVKTDPVAMNPQVSPPSSRDRDEKQDSNHSKGLGAKIIPFPVSE